MYTYVATFLLALALGFSSGWKVQAWRWDSDNLAKLEQQRENERVNRRAADAASEAHEKRTADLNDQFRVIYSEVEHVVEKPLYRDGVCFDADGLRALSHAISPRAAASEPAPAVPDTGSTR